MKHAGDPGLPVRHDPCPCPPPTPRNGRPHARIHRRASVSVSHTGASGNARRSSCVSGHVRRSRRIAPRPSPGAGGPACGRGPGPRRRRRRDLRTAFGPTAFMSCLTCGMPCRYPSRAAKPERREDRALARVFPDRGERHPTRAPARSGTLAVGRALACGGPACSQGNARPTGPPRVLTVPSKPADPSPARVRPAGTCDSSRRTPSSACTPASPRRCSCRPPPVTARRPRDGTRW